MFHFCYLPLAACTKYQLLGLSYVNAAPDPTW